MKHKAWRKHGRFSSMAQLPISGCVVADRFVSLTMDYSIISKKQG